MTVKSYTFDRAKNTAADVAKYQDSQFLGKSSIIKGRGNDMAISTVGLNLTVATGMAIIKGRFVEVSEPEVITLPANTTGYITIRINLGLTNESSGTPGQANYVTNIKQVKLGFQTSLFTDELLDDKTTNAEGSYDFILAKVTTNDSYITLTTTTAIYLSQSQVFMRDSSTNVIVNAPKLRVDNSLGSATSVKRSGSIEANSLSNISTDGALSINDNSGAGISLQGTGSGAVTSNLPYKTTGADSSTGDNFVGNASSASKLKTPRSIIASGDVSGSTVFDGSDNVSLALTLPTITQSNPSSLTKKIGVNNNAWVINEVFVDSKGKLLGRQATSLTVEDQTVGVKADVATLQTDNNANKSDIAALKTDNTTNKSDISVLKTDNTANKSDIASLKTDNTQNKTDISGLKTRTTTLEGKAATAINLFETTTSGVQSLTFTNFGPKPLSGKVSVTKHQVEYSSSADGNVKHTIGLAIHIKNGNFSTDVTGSQILEFASFTGTLNGNEDSRPFPVMIDYTANDSFITMVDLKSDATTGKITLRMMIPAGGIKATSVINGSTYIPLLRTNTSFD